MKRSFYAVLPSHVLTNPDLTDFEKLLYALISSLANSKGYAYASNAYFQKTFNKSERTVRYALANLTAQHLIVVVLFEDQGNKRHIYLKDALPLGQSVAPPLGQSVAPPSYNKKTKRKYINKSIPTNDISIEWFKEYVKLKNADKTTNES